MTQKRKVQPSKLILAGTPDNDWKNMKSIIKGEIASTTKVVVKSQEEVEEETQAALMNDVSFMDELFEAFGDLPKKERM